MSGDINVNRERWEKISVNWGGDLSSENLESRLARGGIWKQMSPRHHFETVLELGCGDGKASFYLSRKKDFSCDRYIAVDISENMLRKLQHLRESENFFPSANFVLVCESATDLELEANWVDLVVSDSMFMHIEKKGVRKLLDQLGEALKPGGKFIFHNSFHNSSCPAHQIHNLVRRGGKSKSRNIYTSQYNLKEIEQLIEDSGIASKCGDYKIIDCTGPVLVPDSIGGIMVPFAKQINALQFPNNIKSTLTYCYGAYSSELFES